MKTPTRILEMFLHREGYTAIAGMDEAGRGAWAGPIVAGAAVFSPDVRIAGVRDSKRLSPKKREMLYEIITAEALSWSVGMVDEREIDRIGIQQANIQAMVQAIHALDPEPDYVLVDGYVKLPLHIEQRQVVDGDTTVHAIACASVLAKVTRDRYMVDLHAQDRRYALDQHKGYGTKLHAAKLRTHGPATFHRKSFAPIRRLEPLTP